MLWRALKHIENGYYIDVGAWRPDVDSVTRAFYERGWQGINIEPDPDSHALLQKHRTRDVNLSNAVGDKTGIQTLHVVRETGLSTLDEDIAQKHTKAGWVVQKREVEIITLAALWEEHVPNDQDVHFLKVDVEGSEEPVLRGNDWSKFRPWIVIVEATIPSSQEESYDAWEPILLTASYDFAYADGLNRFYIANEHAELLPAFKYPPNVFDHIKLDIQQQAEVKAHQAEVKAHQAEVKAHQATTALSSAKTKNDELSRELHSMQASICWRITRPLRIAFDILLWIRARGAGALQRVKYGIKHVFSFILAYVAHFILARPRLKIRAMAFLHRIPALETRLYRFVVEGRISSGGKTVQITYNNPEKAIAEYSDLTPSARCTYTELKAAIERDRRRGY
ncbi:FkbM family methyltransferase [Methanocalculus natronophilus]|uniref:FkbM family methyltransferase n=1 Tax=Methanocalculus natronophilus TaxID=1262400 RepID=UPI0031B580B3